VTSSSFPTFPVSSLAITLWGSLLSTSDFPVLFSPLPHQPIRHLWGFYVSSLVLPFAELTCMPSCSLAAPFYYPTQKPLRVAVACRPSLLPISSDPGYPLPMLSHLSCFPVVVRFHPTPVPPTRPSFSSAKQPPLTILLLGFPAFWFPDFLPSP